MDDGLGVGGDEIVFFIGEVDEARFEGGEDTFDELARCIGGAVLCDDERLTFGGYRRSMEGVDGDDLHILWQPLFKRLDLRLLHARLSTDDTPHLRTRPVLLDDPVDELRFDRVHQKVTRARNGVAVFQDGDVGGRGWGSELGEEGVVGFGAVADADVCPACGGEVVRVHAAHGAHTYYPDCGLLICGKGRVDGKTKAGHGCLRVIVEEARV